MDQILLPDVPGQPDAVAALRLGLQNLGNFLQRLALPKSVRHWSLTMLREKLIKIGAKVTPRAKYVTFQLAEVAVTRDLFAALLDRIAPLAIPPPAAEKMPELSRRARRGRARR